MKVGGKVIGEGGEEELTGRSVQISKAGNIQKVYTTE